MQNFEIIDEMVKIGSLVRVIHQYLESDIFLPGSKALPCCKLHSAAKFGYWEIAKELCDGNIFSPNNTEILACKNHPINQCIFPGMGYMVSNLELYSSLINAVEIAVFYNEYNFINYCKRVFEKIGAVISFAYEILTKSDLDFDGKLLSITENDIKLFNDISDNKVEPMILIVGAAYHRRIKISEYIRNLFPHLTNSDFNKAVLIGLCICNDRKIAHQFINEKNIILNSWDLGNYGYFLYKLDQQFFDIKKIKPLKIVMNIHLMEELNM